MLTLVVDACTLGLIKRFKKRLMLLGIKIIVPPHFNDDLLKEFTEYYNAFLITYDHDFESYSRAIILTQHKRYEEQITELLKKLQEKCGRRCKEENHLVVDP